MRLITQFIIAVAGLVVIRLLAALLVRWASRFVKDSQARYRIRKVSALISYLGTISTAPASPAAVVALETG